MLFHIDHRSGSPIYRQVMDQVRRQIVTGAVPAGDPLPAVRELAARLKVNPMTVSKAYSLLEAEGLLERRRGVGLFVAPGSAPRRQEVRSELLNDVVERAAVTAVQLQVPEAEILDLLRSLYRKHRQNGR